MLHRNIQQKHWEYLTGENSFLSWIRRSNFFRQETAKKKGKEKFHKRKITFLREKCVLIIFSVYQNIAASINLLAILLHIRGPLLSQFLLMTLKHNNFQFYNDMLRFLGFKMV